jgi:Flp pilus assembly protein TadD
MTWLVWVLAGCARVAPASHGGGALEAEETDAPHPEPSPRALASLQLTEQGRTLVEQGEPDDAIRVLEQAVGLNPTNGENLYLLAEAWLLKGDATQAEEFNRLAGLYLKGHDWDMKIRKQRERIMMSRRLKGYK